MSPTTHRTFDLSPYGTPRAVVAQASHLSVDLVRASDQDPDWGLMACILDYNDQVCLCRCRFALVSRYRIQNTYLD